VSVVSACKAPSAVVIVAASPRELGQAISEIAQSGTCGHRNQAEGGDRNTRAGVNAVEQDDERGHSRERKA